MKKRIIFLLFSIVFVSSVHLDAAIPQTHVQSSLISRRLLKDQLGSNNIAATFSVAGIPMHEVKVASQKGKDSYDQAKLKYKFLKPPYGCGFHALKNTLYLARMASRPNFNVRDPQVIQSIEMFLHYLESDNTDVFDPMAPAWQRRSFSHDTIGQLAWIHIWNHYRAAQGLSTQDHTSPPTRTEDLQNLVNNMRTEKALAPRQSKDILTNITIIQDSLSFTEKNHLIMLGNKVKRSSNIVVPFVVLSMGHWFSVVINKFQGKLEILFADSWRGIRDNYDIAKQLLIEMGLVHQANEQFAIA